MTIQIFSVAYCDNDFDHLHTFIFNSSEDVINFIIDTYKDKDLSKWAQKEVKCFVNRLKSNLYGLEQIAEGVNVTYRIVNGPDNVVAGTWAIKKYSL